eukprot:tig00001181_g7442.t1
MASLNGLSDLEAGASIPKPVELTFTQRAVAFAPASEVRPARPWFTYGSGEKRPVTKLREKDLVLFRLGEYVQQSWLLVREYPVIYGAFFLLPTIADLLLPVIAAIYFLEQNFILETEGLAEQIAKVAVPLHCIAQFFTEVGFTFGLAQLRRRPISLAHAVAVATQRPNMPPMLDAAAILVSVVRSGVVGLICMSVKLFIAAYVLGALSLVTGTFAFADPVVVLTSLLFAGFSVLIWLVFPRILATVFVTPVLFADKWELNRGSSSVSMFTGFREHFKLCASFVAFEALGLATLGLGAAVGHLALLFAFFDMYEPFLDDPDASARRLD